MPRRTHFVVTNNPVGKDKLEDVHDPSQIAVTFYEGGRWHRLSDETGIVFKPETIEAELGMSRVIKTINGYSFIPLRLLNLRDIMIHSVRFPDGRVWDAVQGWSGPYESARTEPVTGPRW